MAAYYYFSKMIALHSCRLTWTLVKVLLTLFQVELQHTYKELEEREDMLEASKHVMAEQSRELDKTMDELTLTERENRLLRKSVELLADEKDEAR